MIRVIFSLFLLFFNFANNILFANNNISPLNVAVDTAFYKIKKISSDVETINKSLNTYIPVSYEENNILPFASYENGMEEYPYLNQIIPNKYDILCLMLDETRKEYNIIFLNDNKIYFHYICLPENKMLTQYSLVVPVPEKVSGDLIRVIKQYKLSNIIDLPVPEENLEFIISLFGAYGNEVPGSRIIAYGYNSKIFGIIFGGLLLPNENTMAFKVYSLFDSMMAYFENLKNNDIKRCDLLFIDHLKLCIHRINPLK